LVTTKQFLSSLSKRVDDKAINKNKTLQRLMGKKLNLKWRLKKVSREIALVEMMQRRMMRKRF